MLQLVEKVDMFGSQLQMTVFKSSKFKTFTGGCTTIICFTLVIISCFIFGKDFLFKKNPRVLSQTVNPEKYPEPLQITSENLLLPFRLTDDSLQTLDFENLFYPTMIYYRYEFNSSGNFLIYGQELEIVKCNSNNTKNPQLIKNYKLDDYYCVNWDDYNLTFGGFWDAPFINFFDLKFSFCPYGQTFSPEANCTDLEKVKDSLGRRTNTQFEMLYPEYYFSPEDLENPLKTNYKMYITNLDLHIQKFDRMYFKQILLENDLGWIIDDVKNENMIGYSDIKYDYILFSETIYGREGISSGLYSMTFYYQKGMDKIHRSYMKFQDLASIIGGIVKIITVFGNFFTFFTNQISRNETIYNKFFQFQDEEGISQSEDKYRIPRENPCSNFNDNKSSNTVRQLVYGEQAYLESPPKSSKTEGNNNCNKIELKNIENAFEYQSFNIVPKSNYKFEKQKKNKIKFGLCFTLSQMMCKCCENKSKKSRIYKFVKSYFEERLDIIHYLKGLETIDRIKMILFNKYQNICFEFLKVPNLMNEEELESLEKGESNINNRERKLNELIDYFSQLNQRKELSNKDKKLLSLINPNIAEFSLF